MVLCRRGVKFDVWGMIMRMMIWGGKAEWGCRKTIHSGDSKRKERGPRECSLQAVALPSTGW